MQSKVATCMAVFKRFSSVVEKSGFHVYITGMAIRIRRFFINYQESESANSDSDSNFFST